MKLLKFILKRDTINVNSGAFIQMLYFQRKGSVMKSRLAKIWLIVSFMTIVVVPPLAGWYVRSERNAELEENFFNTASQLKDKKNYDGAISIYDFIIENRLDGYEVAFSGRQIVEAERNSYFTRVRGFTYGFFYGEIESIPSLVGCVSGDVFVWGDFRDFVKNSYRYCTGGEVDGINYALSAVGLASTALPNVDVGLSLCKNLAKFMTAGMRKFLLLILEEAAKLKKYDRVYEFMSVIGTMYKKIGTGVLDVFQMAKGPEHLMEISRFIDRFGRSAYSLILIGGDKALRYGEIALDFTAKGGKSALVFCLKYPKIGARIIKISKKLAWDNMALTLMAVAELLAMISIAHTFILCLALWLWLNLDRLYQLAFQP